MAIVRIGDTGYKILLFECRPGSEVQVADALAVALEGLGKRFQLWKLFGSYDLLCVYEVESFEADLLYAGSIDGITRSNEIFAFAWERGGRAAKSSFVFEEIIRHSAIALSFRKIDPSYIRNTVNPIDIEEIYAEQAIRNDWTPFLSTLGWSEHVTFQGGASVGQVFKRMHDQTINTEVQLPIGEEHKLYCKSLSFLGLRWDICSDLRRLKTECQEPFGKAAREADPSAPTVQLGIMSRPGFVAELAKSCGEVFDATHTDVVLGRHDIYLDLEESSLPTWGDFISVLLKLREQHSGELLDTHVQIQTPVEDDGRKKPHPRRRDLPTFLVSPQAIAEFRKLGDAIAQKLIAAIYAFNAQIGNELIRDCFYDLFRFVDQLVLMGTEERTSSVLREELEKKLERFEFAMSQRAMGAFADLETASGAASPLRGGVQRVLLALNTIPQFVVEETCGKYWTGFSVLGFDRRFWHRGDIVNLPVDRAFDPAEWWGLSHESIHVLAHLDQSWFDARAIRKTLAGRTSGRTLVELDSDIIDLSEILVDTVDFTYSYERDWKLYCRTIWSYLTELLENNDDYVRTRQSSYILRAFAVYYSWKPPRTDKWSAIDALYDKFAASISSEANLPRSLDLEAEKDNVLLRFAELRFGLEKVEEAVRNRKEQFRAWSDPESKSDTRKAVRLIRGRRVAKEAGNPVGLIRGLSATGDRSFGVRVAAILSLWNRYLVTFEDDSTFKLLG